jgi:inosine/xanthosine triphosphatase
MKVAIGSLNKTKIDAVRQACDKIMPAFAAGLSKAVTLHPFAAQTAVPEMPLTRSEVMQGARERAYFAFEQMQNQGCAAELAIGLEGGVFREVADGADRNQAFLQNWGYAYNGKQGYFGGSVCLALPDEISDALFNEGRELAEVIDEMSGLNDVRSNLGAFGILTRQLITRTASFEMAVIAALVPLMNASFYPIFHSNISRNGQATL